MATGPIKKMKPTSVPDTTKEKVKKETMKSYGSGTKVMKFADGVKKAKVQTARGTANDKGRNTAVPANSKLGQELKKKDEAGAARVRAMNEQQRIQAMNQSSAATTKAVISSTTNPTPSTNKKLASYTDKKQTVEKALKEEDKKKTTKAPALTALNNKAKGAKMMKLGKK